MPKVVLVSQSERFFKTYLPHYRNRKSESYGFRCTAAMPMKMLWLTSMLLCVSWSSVSGQSTTDQWSERQMSLMEHTLDTLQAINSRLLSMETRQQTIASRLESIENRQQSTESRLESIESRVLNGECSDHELYGGQIKI